MAIKNEITSLRNMVAPLLPDFTFKLQQDIKTPARNTCAIKRLEAEYGAELTSHRFYNQYPYRFVIYTNSELNAVSTAESIGTLFAQGKKIPVENESAWLTLGSFSCSESFETETAGVYAIIGMINATRYEVKTQEDKQKLARVTLTYYEDIEAIRAKEDAN